LGEIGHLFDESRHMIPQTFLTELDGLQNIWSGSCPPPSLAIAYAFTWLRQNVALVPASPALVHGDASFHNVMASGRRFTALLDWEWAHVGAAAEDLGYCRPAVESAIQWGQFIDAYRRAGGPEVRQEQIDFFSVWGRVRIITMIIAVRALYLAGPAHDLEFAHTAIDELYEWYEKLHIDLERVLPN
jgi:aminoglycoside phosphotransferase (APT) family kinase protein